MNAINCLGTNPLSSLKRVTGLALVASQLVFASTFSWAAEAADTIFTGEHIITMEAEENAPTAIALREERIVWMGSSDDIEAHSGPDTKVVELGDRALLPGFIDAHGHITFLAVTLQMANLASPPVGGVTNIAELQEELRTHMAKQKLAAESWVVGNGYDDSLLKEQRHPTRADLDAVSTDHPIALMHVSGHLAAANSKALDLAGINADTPDPAGGVIRRRPNGEPNGVLEESATYPLRGFMFGASADPMANLSAALAEYASYGITTAQDGATSAEAVSLLQAAAAADVLTMDVVAFPITRKAEPLPEAWAVGEYNKRFKVGGVKLMLDGSPQGKTAFLSKPYAVPPKGQNAEYRGYPAMPMPQVQSLVSYYLGAGIPILAHANGDAAGDMLIQAVTKGLTDNKALDHRTVMIHAQAARKDQLDDMAELNMIPSFFSSHVFYWGDWHRDSVFGSERAANISATRSAVRRNMHFTLHNDAPIVPPNMLRLLWATTNRLTRSGQVLGADQRLTTYEALRAITVDAAYQAFEEKDKGSLAVGKLADLVVLSKNPLLMPSTDLQSLTVEQTWSHGRQVHERVAEEPIGN